jgi:hypothetical protein
MIGGQLKGLLPVSPKSLNPPTLLCTVKHQLAAELTAIRAGHRAISHRY